MPSALLDNSYHSRIAPRLKSKVTPSGSYQPKNLLETSRWKNYNKQDKNFITTLRKKIRALFCRLIRYGVITLFFYVLFKLHGYANNSVNEIDDRPDASKELSSFKVVNGEKSTGTDRNWISPLLSPFTNSFSGDKGDMSNGSSALKVHSKSMDDHPVIANNANNDHKYKLIIKTNEISPRSAGTSSLRGGNTNDNNIKVDY